MEEGCSDLEMLTNCSASSSWDLIARNVTLAKAVERKEWVEFDMVSLCSGICIFTECMNPLHMHRKRRGLHSTEANFTKVRSYVPQSPQILRMLDDAYVLHK